MHRDKSVSVREIIESDHSVLVELLHEGFGTRSEAYWENGLRRLAEYASSVGAPNYGYVLVSGGEIVGVLLLIFSHVPGAVTPTLRCNASSWYVRPNYRMFAPFLTLRSIKDNAVTYLDIWPATHTLRSIEAMGFKKVSSGYFLGIFAPNRLPRRVKVCTEPEAWRRARWITEDALRLLEDHARFGCISLWCETDDAGRAFVFRRRRILHGLIPCALLIYAPSLEDVEVYAGPLWRFLALRGMPAMLVGADRPLRGVIGRYFPDKLPLYAKGKHCPRSTDLSYSEAALLGI